MAPKHTAADRVARMKTFGRKVRVYFRTQAEIKERYALSDLLYAEIKAVLLKAKDHKKKFSKRQAVILEDLYAAKDKVYRAHGIARYELNTVDLP
jgi:hypothetical protein